MEFFDLCRSGKIDDIRSEKDLRQWKLDEGVRLAALHGHLSVVKYLHEQKADIHIGNEDPLCNALLNSHTEIIEYLASNNANMSCRENYPLRWVLFSGLRVKTDIIPMPNGKPREVKRNIFISKEEKVLHWLFETVNPNLFQLLLDCIKTRYFTVAKYLIELKGIEPFGSITQENNLLLREASKINCTAIRFVFDLASFSFKENLDISANNHEAIFNCCLRGDFDSVSYLIRRGAEYTTNLFRLVEAASKENFEEVNVDEKGRRLQNNRTKIVKLLLEKTVKLSKEDEARSIKDTRKELKRRMCDYDKSFFTEYLSVF